MRFSIYRFNPDRDEKPYMQDFDIDIDKHNLIMVLDALLFIKDNLDETLAMRRSCREGVCGSDAMNINGKNCLACITPIRNLGSKVTVRPLTGNGMPVIRDLTVDMTQFFKQYNSIKPYLQNNSRLPAKEHLQSPEERAKLDGLYECILCGCCTSSCPSYWWNPDKFKGPAALLQACRFIEDSRDDATRERLDDLNDAYSLFRCRGIMNCTDVCPKGLNPTKAISQIRTKLIDDDA
ncbi:MAG: succinate dehydrogenase iron-sulfur subunit [Legionellales bacterium]|nr:succinate dehydrogenase iron-sulfur subunit [Legionellales bacterium]|tara:strand:+ start:454 stop:1161 length:708 start_codon:yes stop_codon:yes gene_type:complete